MAVSIELRPASLDDAKVIAPLLRKSDKDEAYAASGLSPERAIVLSYMLCDEPMLGLINNQPAAIWGVNPISLITGAGSPWMVGTELLEQKPKYWLPLARTLLEDWRNSYSVLENHVDVRNRKSIRWLRWMGFEFAEPKPYGPFGMPFHKFERHF